MSVDNVVELSAAQQRVCMPQLTLEDDRVEEGENYILSLDVIFNSFSDLNLKNEVAMVTVQKGQYIILCEKRETG